MLTKFFRKTKYYYVGYIVQTNNSNIYGSGTFSARKNADLQEIIRKIHKFNDNKAKNVIILSCIPVKEDFIK